MAGRDIYGVPILLRSGSLLNANAWWWVVRAESSSWWAGQAEEEQALSTVSGFQGWG